MSDVCQAHASHRPEPTYLEYHHVIPQAWQRLVGPTLFDPRTVALCRTGHGNVHYWLVEMMHTLSAEGSFAALPDARTLLKGKKFVRKEADIAHLAMERWIAAGHDLKALWDANEWGEI